MARQKRQLDLFANPERDMRIKTPFSLFDNPLEPNHNLPESCLSLDLLTPLYRSGMHGLSELGRTVLYHIVCSQRVFEVPGTAFSVVELFNHQRTLPESLASHRKLAQCIRRMPQIERNVFAAKVSNEFVYKGVIQKLPPISGRPQMYRLTNPALEIWLRAFSLQIPEYFALSAAICPILKKEQVLSPSEFWQAFCTQAGVDHRAMPVVPRQQPVLG